MSDRTVPVTMPDWMWGRLATIAENRGVKTSDLLAAALETIVDSDDDRLTQLSNAVKEVRAGGWQMGPDRADEMRAERISRENERIRHLHASGLPDPRIAATLGLTRYQVQYRRTRMGLPSRMYHHKNGSAT